MQVLGTQSWKIRTHVLSYVTVYYISPLKLLLFSVNTPFLFYRSSCVTFLGFLTILFQTSLSWSSSKLGILTCTGFHGCCLTRAESTCSGCTDAILQLKLFVSHTTWDSRTFILNLLNKIQNYPAYSFQLIHHYSPIWILCVCFLSHISLSFSSAFLNVLIIACFKAKCF
jgi:hypothetical protein